MTPATLVTFVGFAAESPNDVQWVVYEAGTSNLVGVSQFHRSCSDEDMNDPSDCGKAAGDGKGNDGGLLNDWLFAGLAGVGGTSGITCP